MSLVYIFTPQEIEVPGGGSWVQASDLILMANAASVSDDSRMKATYIWNLYEDASFVDTSIIHLTSSSPVLTIAGDYSSASELKDNLHLVAINDRYEAAAVRASNDLRLVLAAQSGAYKVSTNDDTNISIYVESTTLRKRDTYSDATPSSNALSALGIDVAKTLTVSGDLTGNIKTKSGAYLIGINIPASPPPVNTSVNQEADAIGVRCTDLVLNHNFNAVITADTSSGTDSQWTDYNEEVFDYYATLQLTPPDENHVYFYDLEYEYEYVRQNGEEEETVTVHEVVRGLINPEYSLGFVPEGTTVKWRTRAHVAGDTVFIADYASLNASGNTLAAQGIRVLGDLTAIDGEWNGRITSTAKGSTLESLKRNLHSSVTGYSPSNINNNDLSAYGIWADGSITIDHLKGASGTEIKSVSTGHYIAGEASGSTVAVLSIANNEVCAYGIKGDSVTLNRMDSTFDIYSELSDVEVNGSISGPPSFTLSGNYSAAGIWADTLTLGEFNGAIKSKISDVTVTVSGAAPDSTSDTTVYSAKGIDATNIVATDNLGGKIDVDCYRIVGWSNHPRLKSSLTAAGIYVENTMRVTGRINSAITVKMSNYDESGQFSANPKGYGIYAKGLAADAFSGTITVDAPIEIYADSIDDVYIQAEKAAADGVKSVGLATGALTTTTVVSIANGKVVYDAFDINGKISSTMVGLATVAALNLRVSGTITTTGGWVHIWGMSEQARDGIAITTDGNKATSTNNDQIELADGGVIKGNVDLYGGENTFVINSGAQFTGKLTGDGGLMNIRFDLAKITSNYIYTVKSSETEDLDARDATLVSTSHITINLNCAETGTYKLFKYSSFTSEAKDVWTSGDKGIAFSYQGQTLTQNVTQNGSKYTASATFTDAEGKEVSATLTYSSYAVTLTVTNNCTLAAFKGDLGTVFDTEKRTATLTWEADEDFGAQYLYEVEYRIDGGKSIAVKTYDTSTTISGFDPGSKIEWRIRHNATNGVFVSDWSAWVDGSLTTSFTADRNATMRWKDNAPSSDYVYDVEYIVDDGDAVTAEAATTTLTVNGLAPDSKITKWRYRYRSADGSDTGEWSSYISGVSFYAKDDTGTATLKWGTAAGNYEVEYFLGDAEESVIAATTTASLTLIDGNAGDTVKWRYRTAGAENWSGWITDTLEDTSDLAPYMADANPSATNPDGDSANLMTASRALLHWGEATGDSEIIGYEVECISSKSELNEEECADIYKNHTNNSNITFFTKYTTAPEILVSQLPNQTYVYWHVRAVDANGNASEWVDGNVFRVFLGDTTPPTWRNLNKTEEISYNVSNPDAPTGDLTIHWTAAEDIGAGVRRYRIKYKLHSESEWPDDDDAVHNVFVDETAFSDSPDDSRYGTVKGLAAGTYDYRIYAEDYVGNKSVLYISNTSVVVDDLLSPEWREKKPTVAIDYDTSDPDLLKTNATFNWGYAEDVGTESYLKDKYGNYIDWDGNIVPEEERIVIYSNPGSGVRQYVLRYWYDESDVKELKVAENGETAHSGRVEDVEANASYSYELVAADYYGNTSTKVSAGKIPLGDFTAPEWGENSVSLTISYDVSTPDAPVTYAEFTWKPATDVDTTEYLKNSDGEYIDWEGNVVDEAHRIAIYSNPGSGVSMYRFTFGEADPDYFPGGQEEYNFSVTIPSGSGEDPGTYELVALDYAGNKGAIPALEMPLGDNIGPEWVDDSISVDVFYDVNDPDNLITSATFTWGYAEDVSTEVYFTNADGEYIDWEGNVVDEANRVAVYKNPGSGVKAYMVSCWVKGNEDSPYTHTVENTGATSYSWTFTGITPSQNYSYAVVALDYYDNPSAALGGSKATLGDFTGPQWDDKTVDVNVKYDKSEPFDPKMSATFTWAGAVDPDTSGEIISNPGSGVKTYYFQYKRASDSWNDPSAVTTFTVEDTGAASYSYVVSDIDAQGYSYRISSEDYYGNKSGYLSGTFGGDATPPSGNFLGFSERLSGTWETTETLELDLSYNSHLGDGGEKWVVVTTRTLTDLTVTIDWDDNFTDENGIAYTVELSNNADFTGSRTYSIDAKSSSLTFSKSSYSTPVSVLGGMSKVYYRVTAKDSLGNVNPYTSSVRSFNMVDSSSGESVGFGGDAVSPTGLSVSTSKSAVGSSKLTFSWSEGSGSFGVTGYTLKVTVGGKTKTYSGIQARKYTLTGQADGKYSWQVVANSGNGTTAAASGTAFIVDTTGPTFKSGAASSAKASLSSLTVKWDAATDANGVKSYVLQYGTGSYNKSKWFTTTVTATTYNGKIGSDGDYNYRIYAVDKYSNVSADYLSGSFSVRTKAPGAPTVKASTTKPTNKNVTLTVTYSAASSKKQYSTDNKTWSSYTKAISVGKNATYYFRGVDVAGNKSKVTTYKVSNIDKTAPKAPTVKASTTKPTNKNITITATFSSDSAKKQYSTDNATWNAYTKAITVKSNGTYYFRGIDAVGNKSKVTTYKVTNIDKTAPKAPTVKASTTQPTNKNVTLKATYSSDSAKKQYSTDKKNWSSYTKAITVGKNGTYYFRGIDEAGNISKVTSIKVSNIDKTAPKAPTLKVSTTAVTDMNVTVKATYSSDSAQKQYSTNNKTWKDYTTALSVGQNGTYYFRGIDAAGNVSAVKSVKIANIADTSNNTWDDATELTGTVLGALDPSVDKVDYYDVEDVSKLMLDMDSGTAKVAFYDSGRNAVEVKVVCANSSVKTVSSMKLVADNAASDKITLSDLDSVKYLKVTSTTGAAEYKLAKLA